MKPVTRGFRRIQVIPNCAKFKWRIVEYQHLIRLATVVIAVKVFHFWSKMAMLKIKNNVIAITLMILCVYRCQQIKLVSNVIHNLMEVLL